MGKAVIAIVAAALALAACGTAPSGRQASAPPAGAGSSMTPDEQRFAALGPPFWVREMTPR